MFVVNRKFGLITSENDCRIVDYEKLGSELKKKIMMLLMLDISIIKVMNSFLMIFAKIFLNYC